MTKEIFDAALRAAFQAHVTLLFQNLCNGIAEESSGRAHAGAEARQRFLNGLHIARLAFDEMSQRPFP